MFELQVSGRPVSIHASPQRRGERKDFGRRFQAGRRFNPRLTSAARRTQDRGVMGHPAIMFQSTPHLSGEANITCSPFSPDIPAFQSTPHLSGEANVDDAPITTVYSRFNPRLTSAARRTQFSQVKITGGRCFNPRLTSAARRTADCRTCGLLLAVSIHASPQRRGEREPFLRLAHIGDVSIHASPQRRGEHVGVIQALHDLLVSIHASPQRRGEHEEGESEGGLSGEANVALAVRPDFSRRFNPRLTSAARRTTGEQCGHNGRLVSIHASPQRRGELELSHPFLPILLSFNPRLTSAARRTIVIICMSRINVVSIHASPQRRGEQMLKEDAEKGNRVSIHASPQRRGERQV